MDFWTFCVVQEFNWFSMGDEPARFFKQTLNKKNLPKLHVKVEMQTTLLHLLIEIYEGFCYETP